MHYNTDIERHGLSHNIVSSALENECKLQFYLIWLYLYEEIPDYLIRRSVSYKKCLWNNSLACKNKGNEIPSQKCEKGA